MSDKINILQFVRVLDRGGIETFIFNHYQCMNRDRIGFDFHLLREQEEAYESELTDYGCRKICVNIAPDEPMMVRRLSSFMRIFLSFRSADCDIIHFHSVSPTLSSAIIIFLAMLSGIPKRTIHAHLAVDSRSFKTIRKVKYNLAKQLISAAGTDFVACSGLAADYYFTKRVIDGNRFFIINNSVDTSKFRFRKEVRRAYRRSLNIEDQWVIGNTGRFVEQKNHKFMLQVLKRVLKRHEDVVLLLVGGEVESEKGWMAKIKCMVQEMGLDSKVIFTGETKETAQLLQAMDVFFFPSLFEGLGIAAVEAQASGLPVVCSCNHTPQELEITEHFIWLDLNDPVDQWADALLTAGNADRTDAWTAVEKAGYSIGSTVKQLEKLYTDIEKRKSRWL